MERIVIIGTTGSGKTTLARKIAARTGVPVVELDDLYWLPDWKGRNDEDFRAVLETALDPQGRWIATGNYYRLRDVVWGRADALVWLDLPFLTALRQLLRRCYSRIVRKEKVCNGNIETWRQVFSRESIVVWFFKTYFKNRKRFVAAFSDAPEYPGLRRIHLTSHQQATEWINTL